MNGIAALAGAAALLAVPAWGGGEPGGGNAAAGRQLYESRCGACHSPDAHRVGPAHRGVFGRRAGSAPGYDYSPALRASGVVWNEATLDRWLSDPEKFIPGQRMGYAVSGAGDRAELIAFLKSLDPGQ